MFATNRCGGDHVKLNAARRSPWMQHLWRMSALAAVPGETDTNVKHTSILTFENVLVELMHQVIAHPCPTSASADNDSR